MYILCTLGNYKPSDHEVTSKSCDSSNTRHGYKSNAQFNVIRGTATGRSGQPFLIPRRSLYLTWIPKSALHGKFPGESPPSYRPRTQIILWRRGDHPLEGNLLRVGISAVLDVANSLLNEGEKYFSLRRNYTVVLKGRSSWIDSATYLL